MILLQACITHGVPSGSSMMKTGLPAAKKRVDFLCDWSAVYGFKPFCTAASWEVPGTTPRPHQRVSTPEKLTTGPTGSVTLSMVHPRGPFLKAQKMANSSFSLSVETSAHLLAGQVSCFWTLLLRLLVLK